MALEYAYGQNLAGGGGVAAGVVSGVGKQLGDAYTQTVIVTGPLSVLENAVPAQGDGSTVCPWVPNGFFVHTARLTSQNGEGTITIECINPGADSAETPASPILIQYQILMVEVQMDLIAHEKITANPSAVDECLKWLATDEAARINGEIFVWEAANGERGMVSIPEAVLFCKAWVHGIRTYNRYYPVIDKQSTFRRVPGLSMNGASVSGGKAKFSADIGTFSPPDIQLDGYAQTGFFKSGDEYRQSGKTFTRSEQWTWTPDGSDSDYAWIYTPVENNNNGGGAGGAAGS